MIKGFGCFVCVFLCESKKDKRDVREANGCFTVGNVKQNSFVDGVCAELWWFNVVCDRHRHPKNFTHTNTHRQNCKHCGD